MRIKLLARMLRLNPKDKRIEVFLSDPEIQEMLRSLLNEARDLKKRLSEIAEEIRALCKLNLRDWDSVIEKVILAETKNNAPAVKRTQKRRKEIETAVDIALEEGMPPSDIQAIVEVMVMGMQPGEASYLLEETYDEANTQKEESD